jgi:hypothetical protein
MHAVDAGSLVFRGQHNKIFVEKVKTPTELQKMKNKSHV